jgi:hypothetical protein
MLKHVKRNSFLVICLGLTWQISPAQDQQPQQQHHHGGYGGSNNGGGDDGSAQQQAPAQGQSSGLNNATGVDSSTSTALDYLFNHKAQEGTGAKSAQDVAGVLADKIKAVDVLNAPGMDDPQVRARFQTYLSLAEVPDARIKEYFGKMTQVSETLKAGDTFGAWKILYSMGEYQDLDAGISRELAHRVETFWNTDRTKNNLEIANTQLQSQIETHNHNADLDAQDLTDQQALQTQKQNNASKGSSSGGSSSSNTNSSTSSAATNSPLLNANADPTAAEAQLMPTIANSMLGRMDMTAEYLSLLEERAKIKLNEIRANKMSDQDRMDFTDYIKTLYTTHRYYHTIIAADFYRALFNEGDYPSDISNQAVAGVGQNGRQAGDAMNQMGRGFGVNGRGPTAALNQFGGMMGGDRLGQSQGQPAPLSIADEVTSALEINNRVSQAIEVFRYKADKGEIAAASDELQQAFVGNEFHPGLQGLPRDEKEKVGEFVSKLEVLKNQLEVRDFEQVESQIADIKKIATDFDSTKPMALVNGIKLEARLHLGKAKMLVQGGQMPQAMEEFQTAAEEWPGNPDLTTDSNKVFEVTDTKNVASTDFDRLQTAADYRGIFARQIEFAVAVKGDSTREQQLKDALEKVQKAEMASEKANMLVMNGDVNGAWETIQLASKDWPDDSKLNKLLAEFSEKSADFVSALNKAEDAEAKKQYGYSLTWYVNAQSTYPPSSIANEGIDRVSKEILAPATAGSASASSNN